MREVQRTEITIKGKEWIIERLDGTVLAASKTHDVQVTGSGDDKRLKTVVHDRIFLRDAKGVEHVLRVRDADVDSREGHHLTILWLKPMYAASSAAVGTEERPGEDTQYLILIYNRDTDEANWKGGTGMSFIYPLTNDTIESIGCLATLIVAFLCWSIPKIGPLVALAIFALYLRVDRKQAIAERALKSQLLSVATGPSLTTSP